VGQSRSLQNNEDLLVNHQTLRYFQGESRRRAALDRGHSRWVGLDVEDVYVDEPVTVRLGSAPVRSRQDHRQSGSVSGSDERLSFRLQPEGDDWTGEVSELEAGIYRVTLDIRNAAAAPRDPIVDIFEVA
jgi:hypothetical protein